jgi:protein TonB
MPVMGVGAMFDLLIASHPKRQRSLHRVVVSIGLHALLIGIAIEGTRQAAEAALTRSADAPVFFVLRPPPEQPPTPEQAPEPPKVDAIAAINPPPKGFQTVVAPTEIPKVIPAIDLSQRALDPRNFTGKGVEGGIAGGVVGGTGRVDPSVVPVGAIYVAADLDEPAQVVFQPAPRYPSVLEEAGVSGSVAIQFVIGPQGKVEPASVAVIQSTDSAFVQAALESILQSSFRPARFRGHAVRQLAAQTIRFTLASR